MSAMVYPLLLAAAFWAVVLILSAIDDYRDAKLKALAAPSLETPETAAVAQERLEEVRQSVADLEASIKAALDEIMKLDAAKKRESVDAQ